jgi:hypothetical protein
MSGVFVFTYSSSKRCNLQILKRTKQSFSLRVVRVSAKTNKSFFFEIRHCGFALCDIYYIVYLCTSDAKLYYNGCASRSIQLDLFSIIAKSTILLF